MPPVSCGSDGQRGGKAARSLGQNGPSWRRLGRALVVQRRSLLEVAGIGQCSLLRPSDAVRSEHVVEPNERGGALESTNQAVGESKQA